MMRTVLTTIFVLLVYIPISTAQVRDTLKMQTCDLVRQISYNEKVDKLVFYGINLRGRSLPDSFIGVKDFKMGQEEMLPTYIKYDGGFKSSEGNIVRWIDDQYVLIRDIIKTPRDTTFGWIAFNIETMESKEIRFDHKVTMNNGVVTDEGSIFYEQYEDIGEGRYFVKIYHYNFYTGETALYHTFEPDVYVGLKAYSKSDDRLFIFLKPSEYLCYFEKGTIKTIPQVVYRKVQDNYELSIGDFLYDSQNERLYFTTRKRLIIDSVVYQENDISYETELMAILVNCYDFQTESIQTLDTIHCSKENYIDINGFELFREGTLLLSLEKRLTEEEKERKAIPGPVYDLTIWGLHVTLSSIINPEIYLIRLSRE